MVCVRHDVRCSMRCVRGWCVWLKEWVWRGKRIQQTHRLWYVNDGVCGVWYITFNLVGFSPSGGVEG